MLFRIANSSFNIFLINNHSNDNNYWTLLQNIIGYYAFYECYGFNGSSIILKNVTKISDYAFANCRGFDGNLIIPNTAESI